MKKVMVKGWLKNLISLTYLKSLFLLVAPITLYPLIEKKLNISVGSSSSRCTGSLETILAGSAESMLGDGSAKTMDMSEHGMTH